MMSLISAARISMLCRPPYKRTSRRATAAAELP